MAIVPHKEDPNRAKEIDRMHKMAKSADGKDKIKSEFGIELGEGKGELPKKESASTGSDSTKSDKK